MILTALAYGALIGSAFPFGMIASRLNPFGHKGFATVMGFGAGLLLAAALIELAPMAVKDLGLVQASLIILLAALAYGLVNLWLKTRGAEHRKRCGGCQAPPSEEEQAGSGFSIVAGTIMDAFPEALILGVATSTMGVPTGLVIALFLGNAAQSMSATSGLKMSGRSPLFIWGLWIGLGILIAFSAAGMAWICTDAPTVIEAGLMAVAAGVLIAMTAEAMLPEASEKPAPLLGVAATSGVLTFLALH